MFHSLWITAATQPVSDSDCSGLVRCLQLLSEKLGLLTHRMCNSCWSPQLQHRSTHILPLHLLHLESLMSSPSQISDHPHPNSEPFIACLKPHTAVCHECGTCWQENTLHYKGLRRNDTFQSEEVNTGFCRKHCIEGNLYMLTVFEQAGSYWIRVMSETEIHLDLFAVRGCVLLYWLF